MPRVTDLTVALSPLCPLGVSFEQSGALTVWRNPHAMSYFLCWANTSMEPNRGSFGGGTSFRAPLSSFPLSAPQTERDFAQSENVSFS